MMPTFLKPDFAPYWMKNNRTGQLTGFMVDLMKELFKNMDLNYTLETEIEDYNIINPDYNVIGKIYFCFYQNDKHFLVLVQGLVDGNYDVVMADLTMYPSRVELIDFSIPFQSSDVIIFKKQSSTSDKNLFAISQPLSDYAWLSILVSVVLVTIILDISIRFGFGNDKYKKPPLYSLWFTICSIFGQGVEDLPR